MKGQAVETGELRQMNLRSELFVDNAILFFSKYKINSNNLSCFKVCLIETCK